MTTCALPDEGSLAESVEDQAEVSVESLSYDLSLPQEGAMSAFLSDADNSAVSPHCSPEVALEVAVELDVIAEENIQRGRSEEGADDKPCLIDVDDPVCVSMYREQEAAVQEIECSNKQLHSSSKLKCEKQVAIESSRFSLTGNGLGGGSLEDGAMCLIREMSHFYKKRSKKLERQRIMASNMSGVATEQKTSRKHESSEKAESSETTESTIRFLDTSFEMMDERKKDDCTDMVIFGVQPNFQSRKLSNLTENSIQFPGEFTNMIPCGYVMNGRRSKVQDRVAFPVRNKRKLQKDDDCNTSCKGKAPYDVSQRKWRNVNIKLAAPADLIGCKCKIYWPDDKVWYAGFINAYAAATGTHRVDYKDGDHEDLDLANESVRLYLNQDEIMCRNLVLSSGKEENKDYQEMTALATALEDYQEDFGHGELVWAKIKGHPMWPAFVMDEGHATACGLDPPVCEQSLAVQFFGSYDYARISSKKAISFSEGLIRKMHSKCKKVSFDQGLKEAQKYMKEGKLPDMMSKLQEQVLNSTENDETSEDDQDSMGGEVITKGSAQSLITCPITIGDLKVLSLGKIVKDSEYFHNENQIWTEGYISVRRFSSIKDPNKLADYKMEVKKDPNHLTKPLFCVSFEDNEKVEGSSPSSCWKMIYQKVDKIRDEFGLRTKRKRHTGEFMFGFSIPQISKLIQTLPYARACFKFSGWFDKKLDYLEQIFPAGYKPVEVDWKHADRCGVCGLDEEYTNNLFLQCDKCRILVHMHCYGEYEHPNGNLWLCQVCRPGSPPKTPLCCLCPIQGGAMKRTTDGRWAHLICAMWIPETCFQDVKHLEPIDGLNVIHKERWKLTCSICKVPYGVCIQCSEPSCYVSFHVLCAKSSGFVFEVLEGSSHKHRGNLEEVEQPVQLLSYCKRHRPCKVEKTSVVEQLSAVAHGVNGGSSFCPPRNVSGCARTEPYNCATRRGRQEPEVRAAASAKRLYVEKIPYIVGGFSRRVHNGPEIFDKFAQYVLQRRQSQTRKALSSEGITESQTTGMNKSEARGCTSEDPNVLSVADRYQHMCVSLKHRLTFGKSAIHGWGVFAKQNHRAGDMVIEYAGELVRPIVADLRERLIYNKLVGAGTYMFRIDDEHVVDATREGSIAHLINHSCEPNCFSRVVAFNGQEHIIIFAKRDIEEGEELSYDYRFTSKGDQLECFCGFPSCRGFVNVDTGDEEPGKILVPCSEITPWKAATS